MIKIDDRWSIDVDAYNYTLQKRLNSTIKRNGVDVLDEDGNPAYQYQSVGYYQDLPSALEGFAHICARDALIKGGTMTIGEAISTIRKTFDDLHEMIKKAVPEY